MSYFVTAWILHSCRNFNLGAYVYSTQPSWFCNPIWKYYVSAQPQSLSTTLKLFK